MTTQENLPTERARQEAYARQFMETAQLYGLEDVAAPAYMTFRNGEDRFVAGHLAVGIALCILSLPLGILLGPYTLLVTLLGVLVISRLLQYPDSPRIDGMYSFCDSDAVTRALRHGYTEAHLTRILQKEVRKAVRRNRKHNQETARLERLKSAAGKRV